MRLILVSNTPSNLLPGLAWYWLVPVRVKHA